MIRGKKQIIPRGSRKTGSLLKSLVVLCLAGLFLPQDEIFAQVINNDGAAISVTSGAVVESKDLENSADSIGNNGTINLSGKFYNAAAGTSYGNGFYNIKGDWEDFGTFSADTSTVTFNGSGNQTITQVSNGETFYYLNVNKPFGIATHDAFNAGNTLSVLKNLNIGSGTLQLGTSTSFLNVAGSANMLGTLLYTTASPQTTSITGNLGGTGTINMSGGGHPHLLNLAGATNALGTLTTAPGSSSKVDYRGGNQTVFPSPNYRNLTISTPGTKILQGNSIVGKDLVVNAGIFDLGPLTNNFEVKELTNVNGILRFSGSLAQTTFHRGDLSGSGLIDMSAGNRSHILNLEGVANSIGSFTSGTGSTVDYIRAGDQNVFISDNYWNLKISGSGDKILNSDISAAGVLTMLSGNIDALTNTLKISNPNISAINRSAGTVIGKLRRAVNTTGSDYLYPVGSDTSYNPMKIKFHQLSAGDLTAQFRLADIGNSGLPLEDLDGNEVWERFTQAYWRLTASSGMNSSLYSVNLNYDGFEVVDSSSRIIKRNDGGQIELDGLGDDGSINGTEIRRDLLVNGISTLTTDLGIGKGRPKIKDQPQNIDVCEGSPAFFEVRSTRLGQVTYQWQIFNGSVWTSLIDGLIYSGTNTRRLDLSTTDINMNGFLYRVILSDKWGNINISSTVLLTVNKIPLATATPASQIVCNNEAITPVVLGTSNNVTGTTFDWVRTSPAGISTTLPTHNENLFIGDAITGSFVNNTLNTITVTFTVTPTGPLTTFCVGNDITFTVTINPTPRILVNIPLADTVLCNGETTGINIVNPHASTSGTWNYNLVVTADPEISGAVANTTEVLIPSYTNTLTNNSTLIHNVVYTFKPNIFNADGTPVSSCASIDTTVIVKIAPSLLSLTQPSVYIGGNNIRCNGLTDSINISPSGGYYLSPYTFEWKKGSNPFSTVEDPKGLTIGDYTYSITDTIGCYFEDNVTLTQPDVLRATADSILSVSCTVSEGGAVYINVSGGSPNPDFNFKWVSPNKTTFNEDLIDVRFGPHKLTITDANNCSFDTTYRVQLLNEMTITPAIPLFGIYPISCYGDSTGTIKVFADGNGDKADYRYYWEYTGSPQTFPDTDSVLTNLAAGEYVLTVVDAWGCEGREVFYLSQPDPITIIRTNSLYVDVFDISCPGLADGVITETVIGGHTAYSSPVFKWTMDEDNTFTSVQKDINGLRAGTYRLSIQDSLSCLEDTIFYLVQPEDIVIDSILSNKNGYGVSCYGSEDGSIDLTLSGGYGEKDYKWYRENDLISFSNTEDQSGLNAGLYHLEVRDKITNCPKAQDFVITQPDTISLSPVIPVHSTYQISCFDGADGSIDMVTIGGAGSYSYNWSSEDITGFNASTRVIDSLKAGIYTAEVTDANNCKVSRTETLSQPEKLTTAIVPATISCFSTNNGAADLTVNGGIENTYSYLWSNGSTTEDINSLFTGNYFVEVTDTNGCKITDTTFVSEPPEILISMDIPAPYNTRMISCFGESDAIVNAHVSGGVGMRGGNNYIYDWKRRNSNWVGENGENDSIITNVPAGNYILTITDGNLCSVSDSIIVEQPFNMIAEVYGTNPTCFGRSDGQITLVIQGGTPEYSVQWSNDQQTQTAVNLAAGRYDVTITDLNNCTVSTFGVLKPLDPITFAKDSINPKCPDTPNGELHYFNINGGTEPYELVLYNLNTADSLDLGLGSDKTVSDLYEGRYRLKITDNNQCIQSDTSALTGKSILCIETPNAFSPNGDGINDTWVIRGIDLYPEVKIEIYNRWGEMVFYAPKGYTKPWDGTYKGRELPIDSYYYVFDLNPNNDGKFKGRTEITGDVTIIK